MQKQNRVEWLKFKKITPDGIGENNNGIKYILSR